jgi:hypothetical protein
MANAINPGRQGSVTGCLVYSLEALTRTARLSSNAHSNEEVRSQQLPTKTVRYDDCIAPRIFSPIASTAWWSGEAARWA